jgi:hypothetical protein
MQSRISRIPALGAAALIAVLCFPPPAAAQPHEARKPSMEAMSIQFEVYPSSLVSNPAPGTFEEVLESTINTARFRITFPVILSPPRTVLLGGITYGFLRFDHRNWVSDNAPYGPQEFHDLRVELRLRRQLSDAWTMTARVAPGLASDFQKVTLDHVNVDGGLVFLRRFSPEFAAGLGAAYLHDFGEPLVLPLLQVNWTPSGKDYMVEAILPRSLAVWWQYRPAVRLGLVGGVQGNRYRIGEPLPLREDATLKFSMGTLGPAIDVDMGRGGTHFDAAAGFSFARQFELRDEGGDAMRTLDLEAGLFLRAGLSFRR